MLYGMGLLVVAPLIWAQLLGFGWAVEEPAVSQFSPGLSPKKSSTKPPRIQGTRTVPSSHALSAPSPNVQGFAPSISPQALQGVMMKFESPISMPDGLAYILSKQSGNHLPRSHQTIVPEYRAPVSMSLSIVPVAAPLKQSGANTQFSHPFKQRVFLWNSPAPNAPFTQPKTFEGNGGSPKSLTLMPGAPGNLPLASHHSNTPVPVSIPVSLRVPAVAPPRKSEGNMTIIHPIKPRAASPISPGVGAPVFLTNAPGPIESPSHEFPQSPLPALQILPRALPPSYHQRNKPGIKAPTSMSIPTVPAALASLEPGGSPPTDHPIMPGVAPAKLPGLTEPLSHELPQSPPLTLPIPVVPGVPTVPPPTVHQSNKPGIEVPTGMQLPGPVESPCPEFPQSPPPAFPNFPRGLPPTYHQRSKPGIKAPTSMPTRTVPAALAPSESGGSPTTIHPAMPRVAPAKLPAVPLSHEYPESPPLAFPIPVVPGVASVPPPTAYQVPAALTPRKSVVSPPIIHPVSPKVAPAKLTGPAESPSHELPESPPPALPILRRALPPRYHPSKPRIKAPISISVPTVPAALAPSKSGGSPPAIHSAMPRVAPAKLPGPAESLPPEYPQSPPLALPIPVVPEVRTVPPPTPHPILSALAPQKSEVSPPIIHPVNPRVTPEKLPAVNDSATHAASPSQTAAPGQSNGLSFLHRTPPKKTNISVSPPKLQELPPPPPNFDCTFVTCTEPWTYTPPGLPCGCVLPIRVALRLSVELYTFFPLVSELAKEIAAGIFMKQSQIRIMGANTAAQQPEKTIVNIYLVPLGAKFNHTTAFLTYQRFWMKQVVINASLFGDYEVLYVQYQGLPASPPVAHSNITMGDDGPYVGHGNNGAVIQPLGVDVPRKRHKNEFGSSMIVIMVLSASIAVVLFYIAAWFFLFKYRDHVCELMPSAGALQPSVTRPAGSAKIYSSSDIERATSNFDSSKILGEGGFGLVYSGELDDGTNVAVKVLKRDDQQGGREFLAEVEMLSRLNHRNLVKLLGICIEDRARCLVYELIPNGSVESHLHGHDKERSLLDWSARIKIALGAARGLAYLHEDSSPRVIHRDFKSSNILLEHDFTPKVSDFGLARAALEEEDRHISTQVMGTFGYVAPEYAMTGHLLVKSDVYSYGVVLLELLTGRKPVDMTQPPGEENLVTWARPLLTSKERLEVIVDSSLGPHDCSFNSVAKVAAIASMCVQPEVAHRPFMGEVVQALKLLCNECDGAREEARSGRISHEGSSIDMDFGADLASGQPRYLASGSDPEMGLSTSDLGFGRQDSGSFRRHSSSSLVTRRSQRVWEAMRRLARGSVSEHAMMFRSWAGGSH